MGDTESRDSAVELRESVSSAESSPACPHLCGGCPSIVAQICYLQWVDVVHKSEPVTAGSSFVPKPITYWVGYCPPILLPAGPSIVPEPVCHPLWTGEGASPCPPAVQVQSPDALSAAYGPSVPGIFQHCEVLTIQRRV